MYSVLTLFSTNVTFDVDEDSHVAVIYLSASLNIPVLAVYGDIPPYNYSKYMKSIVPNDNKFTKTSIKNILFEEAKVKLDEFLNEYNL